MTETETPTLLGLYDEIHTIRGKALYTFMLPIYAFTMAVVKETPYFLLGLLPAYFFFNQWQKTQHNKYKILAITWLLYFIYNLVATLQMKQDMKHHAPVRLDLLSYPVIIVFTIYYGYYK